MTIVDAGVYRWSTENAHHDNTETMSDFINNHLPDGWNVDFLDGTYAEVTASEGQKFRLDAGGGGDSNNHLVNISHLDVVDQVQSNNNQQHDVSCETCGGKGTIDETLGGEWNSNPEANCPDCNRNHRVSSTVNYKESGEEMIAYLGSLRTTEVSVTPVDHGCGAGQVDCFECGGDGDWSKFYPDPEAYAKGELPCVNCKGTGKVYISI